MITSVHLLCFCNRGPCRQSERRNMMGLLPDTKSCVLPMYRECRGRFPRHWLQRKPLVNDPGMHHGTCVTHVPWCMSGSLTHCGGENVPGIPGACTTRNCTYLAKGSCHITTSHRTWVKLMSELLTCIVSYRKHLKYLQYRNALIVTYGS